MGKEMLQKLTEVLPEGWEAAARTEKALQREGRYIKTPEDLLRVLLLYGTEGKTFGMTAALLQITEEMPLSKNAVYERVLRSWPWLRWMCERLCWGNNLTPSVPQWLTDYRVCLVDASNEAVPGSSGADYRLHYMLELFSLNMVEHHVTKAAQGETMTRFERVKPGDLIIGDRAYGTLTGISHVRKKNADCIFRLRAGAFALYDSEGNPFDLDSYLAKQNGPEKVVDLDLYGKKDGTLLPMRICAVRKTPEEMAKGEKQIKKSNKGKKRGKVTSLQALYNRFVLVATTLPHDISAEQILELYRMRWQIELVFKRMKSIFDLGDLESYKEDAVYAWFYIKLLIAALCEALVDRGRFPPEEK